MNAAHPTATQPKLVKPKLRGYLHQEAFFISLGACSMLIAKSTNATTLLASVVYSLGVLILFGVSALYHRPHWEPKPRAFLRRVDHSAVFLLIAGTFTPLCLLAMSAESGHKLLLEIWIVAAVGILQSILWVHGPKWLTAVIYVGMGWLILPDVPEIRATIGNGSMVLLAGGGVIYTIGALFYGFKKPNLFPGIFGYHELLHLFINVAAVCHFLVIYALIR